MIVAKFGGTCITPQNLKKIKTVLTPHHKVVVVSAIGKTFDGDLKVTDLLYRLHDELPDTSAFLKVSKKYTDLVNKYCIDIDIDRLLFDCLEDIKTKNQLDNTVSKGEELSSKIVAKYLGFEHLEAEELLTFSNGKFLLKPTVKKIQTAYEGSNGVVVAGFYGGELSQRRVFSRGGSDITGAIFANAMDASIYENWTDVDGFHIANPRVVCGAKRVNCISYNEMKLLSLSGATVLHHDSVYPTEIKGIPIHIRNIYNPESSGTLVTAQSGVGQVLGIFSSVKNRNSHFTKIVFSCDLNSVLQKTIYSIEQHKIEIYSLCTSCNTVEIETQKSVQDILCQTFKFC